MEPVQKNYSFSQLTEFGKRRKSSQLLDLFQYFLPKLHSGSTVVEIGPGRGEFALEVCARGLKYIGIEPSRELCLGLRDQGFEVINQTVPPLPLENETVDLIHSHDFVEHLVDYREVMRVFLESYRVLKPGGFVSVIGPNYETIKQLFYQYEYQHSFIVTKNRLENMLKDSGFEINASTCYLMFLSPLLVPLDRIIAHTALPVLGNSLSQALIRLLLSEGFAFKLNKNLYDHVAVLGRKPKRDTGTVRKHG
jgi:SAM-dependent methyltransferase